MNYSRLLLCLPLLTAPIALATTDAHAGEAAAAQELFTEARRLIKLGNWAEACPKLEESQRLDPGVGTQFNLADCDEHVGKTATAWALFLEAASASKNGGQKDREKAARARAAALEPKLSRITVLVRSADAGLEVTRDGVAVGQAQWGSAVPVDPGEHSVAATAPGKKAWRTTVTVPAGTAAVPVEVPVLEDAPAPVAEVAAPPPSADSPPVGPVTIPDVAPVERSSSGRRTAGGVIAVVGVVGLGVGATFGILSKGKHDDASSHCRGNVCDPAGASLRDSAIASGNVSTVAISVGAAALVGGAILWLTAPKATPARAGKIRPAPMVGSAGTGIALGGVW